MEEEVAGTVSWTPYLSCVSSLILNKLCQQCGQGEDADVSMLRFSCPAPVRTVVFIIRVLVLLMRIACFIVSYMHAATAGDSGVGPL